MVWHRVPGAPQCQSQRPHAAGRHHHSSAGLLTLRNKKLSQDPVRNLHSQEINLSVLGRWMPQDCASRVETLVGAAFGGTAAAPPELCIAELKHPPQLKKPESGEQLYRFICTYTRGSCWHRGLPGDGTCFLQAQHDLFQPGLQPRCLSCPVTPGLTTTSFTTTAHPLKENVLLETCCASFLGSYWILTSTVSSSAAKCSWGLQKEKAICNTSMTPNPGAGSTGQHPPPSHGMGILEKQAETLTRRNYAVPKESA